MNHAISNTTMSVPELALIAGTRAVLGVGLGLLIADRLSLEQRKAVGWTMFAIGAVSTIPLGMEIFGERSPSGKHQPGKDQLRTAV
jgi:hypothetical protein